MNMHVYMTERFKPAEVQGLKIIIWQSSLAMAVHAGGVY